MSNHNKWIKFYWFIKNQSKSLLDWTELISKMNRLYTDDGIDFKFRSIFHVFVYFVLCSPNEFTAHAVSIYFYIHLFLPTAERSLRPHIKLYHTIVPCRCCGDGADCCCRSSCCGTCSGDGDDRCVSNVLKPNAEPPKLDGFMPPLLIHGTPKTGSGSSGGVTCKIKKSLYEQIQKKWQIKQPSRKCFM